VFRLILWFPAEAVQRFGGITSNGLIYIVQRLEKGRDGFRIAQLSQGSCCPPADSAIFMHQGLERGVNLVGIFHLIHSSAVFRQECIEAAFSLLLKPLSG